MTAHDLIARLRDELGARTARNRCVELIETGRLPRERLADLAGEQYRIIGSDQRSFSLIAARYPRPPAGEFFLDLAKGEAAASRLLISFAAALDLDESDLRAYSPKPLAQAYPHFLAWLALSGTRSEVALAMAGNLRVWGGYCAAVARSLASRYGMSEDATSFFRYFSAPPEGFEGRAEAVIDAGIDAGEDLEHALRAARMMHAYELAFWGSLAGDDT